MVLMEQKPKMYKRILIRIVDNGFIYEASPYSDGSGPDVEVYDNPRKLVNAVKLDVGDTR